MCHSKLRCELCPLMSLKGFECSHCLWVDSLIKSPKKDDVCRKRELKVTFQTLKLFQEKSKYSHCWQHWFAYQEYPVRTVLLEYVCLFFKKSDPVGLTLLLNLSFLSWWQPVWDGYLMSQVLWQSELFQPFPPVDSGFDLRNKIHTSCGFLC